MSSLREKIADIIENEQLPPGSISTRDIRGHLYSSSELSCKIANILEEVEKEYSYREKEAEIKLLRDTAEGFQIALKPEFKKGGQAAIDALILMADIKESRLQEEVNQR